MKAGLMVIGLILVAATVTLAKDPPNYDKGVLLSMDASSCGMAEKGSKTVTGEILGTDGEHKNTEEVLCQEYVLQGDRIVYHIRPVDTKNPDPLPVRRVSPPASEILYTNNPLATIRPRANVIRDDGTL